MEAIERPQPATIQELEQLIQSGLEALRRGPVPPGAQAALDYLLPSGYQPIVQLEEDGRKKRHTAAASNWKPETGELVIYYEADAASRTYPSHSVPEVPLDATEHGSAEVERIQASEVEIKQCCEALDRAEKVGKQFIAYKWFRDTGLLFENYSWTKSAEDRQRVLAAAVEDGAIISSKIFNPKNPQFPTTAVLVNRSHATSMVPPRFQPVAIKGEPASATILKERGSL